MSTMTGHRSNRRRPTLALLASLCALLLSGCCAPCGHSVPVAGHAGCHWAGLPAASLLGPLGGCCSATGAGLCAARGGGPDEPPLPHSKFHPVPTQPVFAPSALLDWEASQPSSPSGAAYEGGLPPASPGGSSAADAGLTRFAPLGRVQQLPRAAVIRSQPTAVRPSTRR